MQTVAAGDMSPAGSVSAQRRLPNLRPALSPWPDGQIPHARRLKAICENSRPACPLSRAQPPLTTTSSALRSPSPVAPRPRQREHVARHPKTPSTPVPIPPSTTPPCQSSGPCGDQAAALYIAHVPHLVSTADTHMCTPASAKLAKFILPYKKSLPNIVFSHMQVHPVPQRCLERVDGLIGEVDYTTPPRSGQRRSGPRPPIQPSNERT